MLSVLIIAVVGPLSVAAPTLVGRDLQVNPVKKEKENQSGDNFRSASTLKLFTTVIYSAASIVKHIMIVNDDSSVVKKWCHSLEQRHLLTKLKSPFTTAMC
jgi:hypothetical protein